MDQHLDHTRSTRFPSIEPGRQLLIREHDLLQERTNFLLVTHAVLLASVPNWYSLPAAACLGLCALGVVLSALWLVLGYKASIAHNWWAGYVRLAEKYLPESEGIITSPKRPRAKAKFRRLRPTWVMGYWLPSTWLAVWFILAGARLAELAR